MGWRGIDVNVLLGKTLMKVEQIEKIKLIFTTTEGKVYKMYHEQDCCEDVYIEDVIGELDDLVGSPLTMAEEVTNDDYQNQTQMWSDNVQDYESYTWTFYKFATVKGYVTLRWFGTSNGYYSESVDFVEV